MVTPAGKAFVDTVPFPLLFGQLSPLCASAQNPQRRFNKPATLGFLPDVHPRLVAQELDDLRPLVVS